MPSGFSRFAKHPQYAYATATGRKPANRHFYPDTERYPRIRDERFHHNGVFCPECYHCGPSDCHKAQEV